MFGKNKTPSEKYIAADKKRQKLRNQRAKLNPYDPNFEKKDEKFMNKIHAQKVIMEAAEMESKQPLKKTTNITTNLNYNKTESGVHFHGHYHNSKKNSKRK